MPVGVLADPRLGAARRPLAVLASQGADTRVGRGSRRRLDPGSGRGGGCRSRVRPRRSRKGRRRRPGWGSRLRGPGARWPRSRAPGLLADAAQAFAGRGPFDLRLGAFPGGGGGGVAGGRVRPGGPVHGDAAGEGGHRDGGQERGGGSGSVHARHSGPSRGARTPSGRRMARTGDLRGVGVPCGDRRPNPAAPAGGCSGAIRWAVALVAAAIRDLPRPAAAGQEAQRPSSSSHPGAANPASPIPVNNSAKPHRSSAGDGTEAW